MVGVFLRAPVILVVRIESTNLNSAMDWPEVMYRPSRRLFTEECGARPFQQEAVQGLIS